MSTCCMMFLALFYSRLLFSLSLRLFWIFFRYLWLFLKAGNVFFSFENLDCLLQLEVLIVTEEIA